MESAEGGWSSAQSLPLHPLPRVTPTTFSASSPHSQEQSSCKGAVPCSLIFSLPDHSWPWFLHADQPSWGLPFAGYNELIPKCNFKGVPVQISGAAVLSPSPYMVQSLNHHRDSAECTQLIHQLSLCLPERACPLQFPVTSALHPEQKARATQGPDSLCLWEVAGRLLLLCQRPLPPSQCLGCCAFRNVKEQ